MLESVTWKIGGEAGFGIMSSGTMLAKSFSRLGYHVFAMNEYPSLIRGGHNVVTLRIATDKFTSLNNQLHILVALNSETVTLHQQELTDGSLVIFDPHDRVWQETDFPRKVKLVAVPLSDIVKEHAGEPVMRNTIALGATVALLGADFECLAAVIRDQFKRKGQEVVDHNLNIAKAGHNYIKTNYKDQSSVLLSPASQNEKLLLVNGSEAVGLGAVCAGLKFAAIYPMTPINALITFLADHAKELKIIYKQPEDEIAGINMALGASLAGVRSMVATSGGGFALMVEGLSWAGMIEVPLVIDLGMRVGPSTGMPTWTEQGELQFVIHAGHGEFPRVVLAPGDAEEAYNLTTKAFNLADRYQIPVFVLTDKYLNESQWCVSESFFQKEVLIDRGKLVKPEELPADGSFKRYNLEVSDGVSPRSVVGMPHGYYIANSYEHDEIGHVTENPQKRTLMAAKRLKKLTSLAKDIQPPAIYGDQDAELTLVSWGSTKGPILEALKFWQAQGKKVRLVHFAWLFPFPSESVMKILSPSTRMVDIEHNATGQLAALIREHTGIKIEEKLLKNDGRPFYPEEIMEKLKIKD